MDRAAARDLNKILRAAGEPIVEQARRNYYSGVAGTMRPQGYQRRTGRSLRGIRGETSFGSVTVALGGSRWPWLLGQEWGSKKPGYRQRFGPPRGRWHAPPGRAGTFFWPAYRDGRDDAQAEALRLLEAYVAVLAGRRGAVGRLTRGSPLEAVN